MAKAPLILTYYIAAPMEKVWEGFVSKEANQTIFMGADFELDLRPGGAMTWSGPGKDGKPMRYVTGEVLRVEAPKLLEYRFGMGDGKVMSRVKVELTPETEAVKVVVTNDECRRGRSCVCTECGRLAADSFAIEDSARDRENVPTPLAVGSQPADLLYRWVRHIPSSLRGNAQLVEALRWSVLVVAVGRRGQHLEPLLARVRVEANAVRTTRLLTTWKLLTVDQAHLSTVGGEQRVLRMFVIVLINPVHVEGRAECPPQHADRLQSRGEVGRVPSSPQQQSWSRSGSRPVAAACPTCSWPADDSGRRGRVRRTGGCVDDNHRDWKASASASSWWLEVSWRPEANVPAAQIAMPNRLRLLVAQLNLCSNHTSGMAEVVSWCSLEKARGTRDQRASSETRYWQAGVALLLPRWCWHAFAINSRKINDLH